MRANTLFRRHIFLCLLLGALAAAAPGCHGRVLQRQQLTPAHADALGHQQQQQQHRSPLEALVKRCKHLAAQLQAAGVSTTARSSSSIHAPAAGIPALQHVQRSLLGFRPSEHEQHTASKHGASVSGWHAASVTLLCLLAMAVLGFMAYKAMQWLDRARRPGYVELQALDTAFHQPTFTL